jgi:hypothetical protein
MLGSLRREAHPTSADDTLADLIDKLVAIQLTLRPLCHDEVMLPLATKQSFDEGCEILQAVISDLVAKLREVQLPRANGGDEPKMIVPDGT